MRSSMIAAPNEDDRYDYFWTERLKQNLRTNQFDLSLLELPTTPAAWPAELHKLGATSEAAHLLANEPTEFARFEEAPPLTRGNTMIPVESSDFTGIKPPSRVLPAESVVTAKDAFHAGLKTGFASHISYRGRDYAAAFFGKRP